MGFMGYDHIELRDGVPWLTGTQIKVVEIAEDLTAGWDGQAIHENHPWISLPKIYSALAYYFEHKDEVDREIARREQFDQQMRETYHDAAFESRLEQARSRRVKRRA